MHRQKEATTAPSRDSWSQSKAQEMFGSMLEAGNAICAMCSLNLADATLKDVEANDTESPRPKLSECLHLVCGSCLTEENESTRCPVCQPIAHCLGYRVSFTPTESLASETKETLPTMKPGEVPTKIVALMESLKSLKAHDKCVVFSYWTYTLDLIESSFTSDSIQYTRVDGRLSSKKRNTAIQEFQEDPSIRVILVSITCGGTGLDLTAGSVVYLMEPQWNPMMEEQALCRVHRMGQNKEVTTIRYRMKNSFEEQVVTVQERKKDLAALTFSNGKISEADVGAARLQYLRAALG
ncbi:SNF2 family domain-containing protein [Rutstroemia sp. NJR-2017a WRK4]|nr:SNF2 family domain-containing protein [Rutstroemia sp. NJR-2017a WRK4]